MQQMEPKYKLQQLVDYLILHKHIVGVLPTEIKVTTEFYDWYVQEITNTVNGSEAYELIQANNAVQLVYDVIEAHYNDSGKVLDIKDAAEHVENYLFEESKKVFNLKKMQSMLNPTQSPKPAETKSQPVAKPTLSNSLAASQAKAPKKFLSDDESKALAASMIKWED
jgi:hypothetical protein